MGVPCSFAFKSQKDAFLALTLQYDCMSDLVRSACILEAAAPKAGNVHPKAEFHDCTFEDFVRSAEAVSPHLTGKRSVGEMVFSAVKATQEVVATNTNLGIILLLAPLCKVRMDQSLRHGIGEVLEQLTMEDASLVYEAIRLAQPGGIGKSEQHDVSGPAPVSLIEAMHFVAEKDRIARQYCTDFEDVLQTGVHELSEWSRRSSHWQTVIVGLQLSLLSRWPDSLIARKCGIAQAETVRERASMIMKAGWPESGHVEFEQFDAWLRSDGNRLNPGTTADLIAAILFAAMRENVVAFPAEIEA